MAIAGFFLGIPVGVVQGTDSDAQGGVALRAQLELAREASQPHSQIEIIRRILDEEPGNAALREELVNLWLEVDDPAMAVAVLESWNEAPPELHAVAQSKFLESTQPEESRALLVEYLEGDPASARATAALATFLSRTAQFADLASLLDRSPLTSQNASLLLMRAGARRAVGNFSGALEDFHTAQSLDAENPEVLSQAASYERLAIAAPHISAATSILENSPSDLRARITRSFWSTVAGLPREGAHADALAALETHPTSAAAKICAALASGLSPYEALEKFSANPSARIDAQQVERLLAMDLAVSGDDLNPRLQRADFLISTLNQPLLGLEDARAAVVLEPENASALLMELNALIALGRTEEAAAAYLALESARPSKSQLAEGLYRLAELQFAQGRLDASLESIGRSISLAPSARSHKLRGSIYQRLGRVDEAASEQTRATALESRPAP